MNVGGHTDDVNFQPGSIVMDTSCLASPRSAVRAAHIPAHRWRVLAAGVAANMSFSAAAACIPTTAVWMRSAYQLDNGALGLVLGALGFGVALSELPWGMAADRFGDRRVLLTGLIATAAMLFDICRSTFRAALALSVQFFAIASSSSFVYGADAPVITAFNRRWVTMSAKRRFGAVECV